MLNERRGELRRAARRLSRWCGAVAMLGLIVGDLRAEPVWKFFRGMCDASALEMLDEDLFVAANDEDNVLRVYSRSREGFAVQTVDFSSHYRLAKKKQEIDFEGAARIGNRIYWISSHGANAKGKFQPSRHRLFATDVISTNGAPKLVPVGRIYSNLLRDLAMDPRFTEFQFIRASQRAPKAEGGLNIEGLAATPQGHLLIGFRNPIPDGKALIIPLLNPHEVVEGRKGLFGAAIRVELKGMGIRSITPFDESYLIVAGSHESEGVSQLYVWNGKSEGATLLSPRGLAGNPEGLAVLNESGKRKLFVVSDDGTETIAGRDCKKLKDPALKVFRGYELDL